MSCRVPREVETKISQWVRFQFSEGQSDRQVRVPVVCVYFKLLVKNKCLNLLNFSVDQSV
jgi:hypothetical protein